MIFNVISCLRKKVIQLSRTTFLLLLLLVVSVNQTNADTLVIWSSDEVDPRALQESGKQFSADTGLTVNVRSIPGFKAMKTALAASKQLPDIIIWPHNRFGMWAEEQILQPIKPSKQIVKDLSDEWQSVTYAGDIYGYPISLQGPTLTFNKQLVKKAPKSWNDLQKISDSLSLQGKSAISWDYSNIYFSYPLVSAEGGYLFKTTKTGWNIESVGVNHEGSVRGLTLLKTLVSEGVISTKTGYRQANQLFSSGKSAMTINGPWAWQNYKRSGVELGIAPFPKVKSNNGKGLYTVMSAGITMNSTQEDLAKSFIEHYIFNEKTLNALANKQSPAQYTHKKFMKEHIKNLAATDAKLADNLKSAIEVWQAGEPLPNVSALPGLNNQMAIAINALVSGRMDVNEALDEVANNF